MKLEKVLPALREGKKIRKNKDVYFIDRGELFVKGTNGYTEVTAFDSCDFFYQDWEIVPKPKKFEAWINLDSDGYAYVWRTKEEADKCAHLDRVECRKIEWEVGG